MSSGFPEESALFRGFPIFYRKIGKLFRPEARGRSANAFRASIRHFIRLVLTVNDFFLKFASSSCNIYKIPMNDCFNPFKSSY